MKTFESINPDFTAFEQMLKQAIDFNETFVAKQTTYSAQIIYPELKQKILFGYDRNKFSVMGVISSMKAYLKRNPVLNDLPKIASTEIQYFKFSDVNIYEIEQRSGEVQTFTNVIEIDLTAAYFYSALKMNIISKELFDKIMFTGNEHDKIERKKSDRLKILGSMAVRTLIQEYRNGEKISERIETNDLLRNCWFNICKYVDDLFISVLKSIPENDFLFYFVDGIYFIDETGNTSEKIKSFFEFNEMPFKQVRIKQFDVLNKNGNLYICLQKENGKSKKFIVPKREIYYYQK